MTESLTAAPAPIDRKPLASALGVLHPVGPAPDPVHLGRSRGRGGVRDRGVAHYLVGPLRHRPGFGGGGKGRICAACRRRCFAALALSAVLIAVNWSTYVWAVSSGRTLSASLGYYLNPLLNMAAGALLFKERIDRAGLVAIGLAAVGVALQGLALGEFPWVSLVLAVSFCGYGIVRKTAAVEAQTGASGGVPDPRFARSHLRLMAGAYRPRGVRQDPGRQRRPRPRRPGDGGSLGPIRLFGPAHAADGAGLSAVHQSDPAVLRRRRDGRGDDSAPHRLLRVHLGGGSRYSPLARGGGFALRDRRRRRRSGGRARASPDQVARLLVHHIGHAEPPPRIGEAAGAAPARMPEGRLPRPRRGYNPALRITPAPQLMLKGKTRSSPTIRWRPRAATPSGEIRSPPPVARRPISRASPSAVAWPLAEGISARRQASAPRPPGEAHLVRKARPYRVVHLAELGKSMPAAPGWPPARPRRAGNPMKRSRPRGPAISSASARPHAAPVHPAEHLSRQIAEGDRVIA